MAAATISGQAVKREFENNMTTSIFTRRVVCDRAFAKPVMDRHHGIPSEMPDQRAIDQIARTFEFVAMGFVVVQDLQVHANVQKALQNNDHKVLFNEVAKALNHHIEGVCLVTLETLKAGKRVIYLNYAFNAQFNEVLKGLGARYNATRKAWAFDLSDRVIADLSDPLNAYFSAVINVTEGVIYKNRRSYPKKMQFPFSHFDLCPYPLRVEGSKIYKKYKLNEVKSVKIFSLGEMIPFPKEGVFDTHFPFLLFQVEQHDARPYLILYSVIGDIEEDMCLLREKIGKELLDKYVGTCRSKREPTLIPASGPAYVPGESEKDKFHGPFKDFHCFDEFRLKFPQLKFFPLSDDYVLFWIRQHHQYQRMQTTVTAYVVPGNKPAAVPVAKYFGAHGDEWPIMFVRQALEEIVPEMKSYQDLMRMLLCHEVAHCLVEDTFPDRNLPAHGFHWYAAYLLLVEAFPQIELRRDSSISDANKEYVDLVFKEKMQGNLARMRRDGPISKRVIVSMLRRFDDCLDYVPEPLPSFWGLAMPT